MIIHWHKRAATQLQQVEDYVLQHFGERIRKEFMDEVEQVVTELADMPTMGKLDPLFAHRKQAYRSIIVRRLNKLVYYVKDNTLHVAAFWDVRREPQEQTQQTK
ncbi:MAG: type II toxin-antitoxin system RelE/ParE family toxin [Bacteroidaceae bacterium]|nr:type II toxin-antitoxin system RelE/ParE family toxin [Bacteroidaceae bacterium]